MKDNCIVEYMGRHGILTSEVFRRAFQHTLGRKELTETEEKQLNMSYSAYCVHGTIPQYVTHFCDG